MANEEFDKSFDAMKAAAWKAEVDAEFDQVNELLSKVHTSLTTYAGQGDTWMDAMINIGNKENEAWQALKSDFNKVADYLGQIFSSIGDALSSGVEQLKDSTNASLKGYK